LFRNQTYMKLRNMARYRTALGRRHTQQSGSLIGPPEAASIIDFASFLIAAPVIALKSKLDTSAFRQTGTDI